jgi:O-antigen ligase
MPYIDHVQPHNTYLGALAEIGILGLTGLLAILLPILWRVVSFDTRQRVPDAVLGIGVAYAVVLAHLITFDGIARYPLWIFAGMCYGIVSTRKERILSAW